MMADDTLDQDGGSRVESAWPAERVPGRLDAEQANRPLEISFMQSFKQALFRDERSNETVEYLNDDSEILMPAVDHPNSTLSYPLMMFSRFPAIPPGTILHTLVNVFLNEVHPKMTLLCCIPVESLQRGDRPPYLTYAMATIGSLASDGDQTATEDLWWAANTLIAATLEVDNREARNADLWNAWVILETYGTLSADHDIWHRTNLTHGFVETAARRLCLSYPTYREADREHYHNGNGPAIENSSSAAMPAFILIDMLRSVHYGLPPTLARSEFSPRPTSLNNDYNTIYANIVNSSSPPPGMGQDDAFLALVAILGEVHTLSTVFYLLELTDEYDVPQDKTSKPNNENINFQNPYLPFSPLNENRQVREKLQKALDLWGQHYLGMVSQDIAILFYFCKMYLALPSLSLLPTIAGYTPRSSYGGGQNTHRTRFVDSDLADGSEALSNAWLILDKVTQSEDLTPVWIPIVLFYASLVVWRMVSLQTGTGKKGMSGSLRVLQLFKSELEQMKWPCCQVMGKLLQSLMAAKRSS